jgi:hypothetical protein
MIKPTEVERRYRIEFTDPQHVAIVWALSLQQAKQEAIAQLRRRTDRPAQVQRVDDWDD